MMEAADLATPLAAFVAGLATSVHCTLMCGPLGCALLGPRTAAGRKFREAVLCYHGLRLASYTAIGALLGAIGMSAAGIFHTSISRLLPWALVLLFVVLAFGWERKIPQIPLFGRWIFRLRLWTGALPRYRAAAMLGAVTPFLPCGPLYLIFGVALVSGSWMSGAILAASFAVGTIPFYAMVQIGALHWQAGLSANAQLWIRRSLALGSAILVGGRAIVHTGSLLVPLKCLLCH
jgi:sulfite exporter TauE/SafE